MQHKRVKIYIIWWVENLKEFFKHLIANSMSQKIDKLVKKIDILLGNFKQGSPVAVLYCSLMQMFLLIT